MFITLFTSVFDAAGARFKCDVICRVNIMNKRSGKWDGLQ